MNKLKSMRNRDSLPVYQKICLHCCSPFTEWSSSHTKQVNNSRCMPNPFWRADLSYYFCPVVISGSFLSAIIKALLRWSFVQFIRVRKHFLSSMIQKALILSTWNNYSNWTSNYVLISQMLQVACSIFPNVNQSACSTLDWVLDSESDFGWVLYKNNWEFPLRKKITPMLSCPIGLVYFHFLYILCSLWRHYHIT